MSEPRAVAFDATPLELGQPSGVGRYVGGLLAALRRHPHCPPLVLLAARPLPPAVRDGLDLPPVAGFPNRTIWMHAVLPAVLRRLKPRLTHYTNFVAPAYARRPYLTTIHDMSLYLHPETLGTRQLLALRPFVARSARRATGIVTVSAAARSDILRVFDVAPERIHVLPPAPDPAFHQHQTPDALQRVRARYDLTSRFLLFVGNIEPRKNLRRLFDAFARVRADHPDLTLVLAGQLAWKYRAILAHRERLGLTSSVRLLGYVPADDLPPLYALATAVTLPSTYEGFGIPILEAMASGVPVVTSATGAMAEVGADAAVLVDPESSSSIAAGLSRVLEDAALRDTLRARGLRRAADFSWDRSADALVRLYDTLGDGPAG